MLAGVQVEHEVGQRPLQPRSQVPVHGKARAGEFGGALQIEHAQLFAQFPVRLGREIEFRRLCPSAGLPRCLPRVFPTGTLACGRLGMPVENLLQAGFAVLRRLSRVPGSARAVPWFRQSARLASCPLFFSFAISSEARLRWAFMVSASVMAWRRWASTWWKSFSTCGRIHAALAQLFFDQGQVVANKVEIKHGRLTTVSKKRREGYERATWIRASILGNA